MASAWTHVALVRGKPVTTPQVEGSNPSLSGHIRRDMGKYNTKRIHHNKCDGGKAYEEVYPNGEHKWFCLGQVDAQYELPVPYDLYDEKCRECPRLFREGGE